MVKQKKGGKPNKNGEKSWLNKKKWKNMVKRARRWGRCFTRIFHLRKRERERDRVTPTKNDEVGFLKKLAEIVIIGFLFF